MDKDQFRIRFAQLRIQHGYTARGLSTALGQSPSYVTGIENGNSLPSMGNFLYYCELLGITPLEFFDTENKIVPSPRAKAISAMAEDLSEDDFKLLLEIVERLNKNK